jgi:hypothetical protein
MPSEAAAESGRRYVPPPHQAGVDAVFAAHRAQIRRDPPAAASAEAKAPRPGLFKPAPPAPPPSTDELDHRLAEELDFAVRHLERIGGALVSDPVLLHRHGSALQGLDLVSQNLRLLSTIISAGDRACAVDRIGQGELKRRLTRRRIDPIAE